MAFKYILDTNLPYTGYSGTQANFDLARFHIIAMDNFVAELDVSISPSTTNIQMSIEGPALDDFPLDTAMFLTLEFGTMVETVLAFNLTHSVSNIYTANIMRFANDGVSHSNTFPSGTRIEGRLTAAMFQFMRNRTPMYAVKVTAGTYKLSAMNGAPIEVTLDSDDITLDLHFPPETPTNPLTGDTMGMFKVTPLTIEVATGATGTLTWDPNNMDLQWDPASGAAPVIPEGKKHMFLLVLVGASDRVRLYELGEV